MVTSAHLRLVIPATAGTQRLCSDAHKSHRVPAFAGTTKTKTKHATNG
jgi:hypothetical protein